MQQLPLVPAPHYVAQSTGALPPTANTKPILKLSEGFGPEGYELEISADVRITASTEAGLRNGLRTLAQLELTAGGLPQVVIKDEPQYAWRGFSLDVARHWYGVDICYRIIDFLAYYKFNVFHLHLTDDQGWRIEIPAYPALTDISSKYQVGGPITAPTRAYLTLAEYRDIQEYALARGITVVPEIDFPGHVNAALHALPALNPGGIAPPANYGTEVGISQLQANDPVTNAFLTEVLSELCVNTIGEYIHIGGDEVAKLPADDYHQLLTLAIDTITNHGKKTVAWQEAGKLADYPEAESYVRPLLQFWTPNIGSKVLLTAAQKGYQVILSPANHVYLDMKYDENDPVGQTWSGCTNLARSRNWEPAELLADLPTDLIVGIEGCLWSETCHSIEDMLSLVFPRIAAVADIAWSAPGNAETFITRLEPHTKLWHSWNLPLASIERLQGAIEK